MEELVLIVLIVIALLVIFPLITLIRISSLKRELGEITRKIDLLTNRIKEQNSIQREPGKVRIEEIPAKPEKEPERIIPQEEPMRPEPLPVKEEPEIILPAPAPVPEKPAPVIPVPAVPQTPGPQKPEKIPAKKKEAGKSQIEQWAGENLLSKIGVITLVLGIAFFVKYAIDKNWINETGRVAIGLLTGGILIGIAHKLRKKYDVFSSLLAGGGIAVFYITITLAFREYGLFGQTPAFILLILITAFCVLLSLLYNRKELAVISLLGGFASPLLVSDQTGNYVVLFSYLFILNTGMLFISYRKSWRAIGMIAYLLSWIFFGSWLMFSFENQTIGSWVFASLFFVQFYLLAIFDHIHRKGKITGYQIFLIITNNLFYYICCLYIFNASYYDYKGIITIGLASVNALLLSMLFRKSTIDRNLVYLLIGIVLSFVSLAIPVQLDGYAITMFWAVETVLLLWLWQKSGVGVFRSGFVLVSLLTIISYLMDLQAYHFTGRYAMNPVFNSIFITGLVMIGTGFVAKMLVKKEDPATDISFGRIRLGSMREVRKVVSILLIFLGFIVPYSELNYQVEYFFDNDSPASFRNLLLATYTILYMSFLAYIYRNNRSYPVGKFLLFFIIILLYAISYSLTASELREDIYAYGLYPARYFYFHFLSLPAVGYIVYRLAKDLRSIPTINPTVFTWLLVIVSVAILSVETDHIGMMLAGNYENYHSLLFDIHTFIYPILWGILSTLLMIWGLKKKEVLLRKISLVFFLCIIGKFYLYDVWEMSQTGRIISFIIFGLILLVASFMQQRIKTLVKNDTENENNSPESL